MSSSFDKPRHCHIKNFIFPFDDPFKMHLLTIIVEYALIQILFFLTVCAQIKLVAFCYDYAHLDILGHVGLLPLTPLLQGAIFGTFKVIQCFHGQAQDSS